MQAFGVFWRALAVHRQLWAEAIKVCVQGGLEPHQQAEVYLAKCGLRIPLLHAKSLHPVRFLDFISNRHRDVLGGSRLRSPIRLLVFCSSLVVMNMISGVTKPWEAVVSHVRYIRWLFYLFELRWGCMFWPDFSGFIMLREKKFGILGEAIFGEAAWGGPREVLVEEDMQHASESWFVLSCEAAGTKEGKSRIAAHLQKFIASEDTARAMCCDERSGKDACIAEFEAIVLGLRMFIKFLYRAGVAQAGDPEIQEAFRSLPLV